MEHVWGSKVWGIVTRGEIGPGGVHVRVARPDDTSDSTPASFLPDASPSGREPLEFVARRVTTHTVPKGVLAFKCVGVTGSVALSAVGDDEDNGEVTVTMEVRARTQAAADKLAVELATWPFRYTLSNHLFQFAPPSAGVKVSMDGTLPSSCRRVHIETMGGRVVLAGMQVENVKLLTVNAPIELVNVAAKDVHVSTIKKDIHLAHCVVSEKLEAINYNATIELDNTQFQGSLTTCNAQVDINSCTALGGITVQTTKARVRALFSNVVNFAVYAPGGKKTTKTVPLDGPRVSISTCYADVEAQCN